LVFLEGISTIVLQPERISAYQYIIFILKNPSMPEFSKLSSLENGTRGSVKMSTSPRCVVGLSPFEKEIFFPEGIAEPLHELFEDVRIENVADYSTAEWHQMIRECDPDVVVAAWSSHSLPPEFGVDRATPPYVCNLTGSVKHLVNIDHFRRGVIVSDWGPSAADSVAEAGLMFTLMALRRASHWHHVLHEEKGWTEINGNKGQLSLYDRRIGIHGFGRVAQAYARLVRPFSPQLFTYCPDAPQGLLDQYGVTPTNSLEELCDSVEIFVEMAALTPETRGSVTEELLRRLPPHGAFINVGRGPVVDEEALIKLAAEGRLRVALDVFEKEPLAVDSPLRENRDITILPHQAGPTEDHMRRLGAFALENIGRFLRGEPIKSQITLEIFERMS
jgi:phosphoglycerate dehydrogenase-like enzyme